VDEQRPSTQFVQSLARGLAVIRAFDATHQSMTLSEVSRRTQLSRATARRLLLTLAQLGYVWSDGKYFELTPQVLQIGYSYLSGQSLPQIAEPVLKELSADLNESTSLSVLDGRDIVYIARIHTRSIMRVGISVGTRLPAYATSMGRVMLAGLSVTELDEFFAGQELMSLTPRTITLREVLRQELARVAEQGWAMVDQELELSLRSLAVPVRGRSGEVVAALNVSMKVSLHEPPEEVDFIIAQSLPKLKQAAATISSALRALPDIDNQAHH
jgi:IclR family pca regulon transcriptional regulator